MPIDRVSAKAGTLDRIPELMARDGAVIVEEVMEEAARALLLEQMEPYVAETAAGQDAFSGQKTTRTGALAARSQAARDLIMHPLTLSSARSFLEPFCDTIQLHVTQIIRILPGQTAQPLHRDRWAWTKHLPGSLEPQFNTMWALTDFTAENGATVVAPGSHRWADDKWPSAQELTTAEMPAGSVLFFSGSVVHGGGANMTDAVRVGVNIDYCLGWLRQEENQYLCCPPHVARALDPALQKLLGYAMGSPALGYFSAAGLIPRKAGVLQPEDALDLAVSGELRNVCAAR